MNDKNTPPETPQSETYSDRPLRFSIPGRHARGRAVRIEESLADILSAHAYPPAIEALLTEAVTLAALLGSLLKDVGGELTMQAQTEAGAVTLLVCDYRDGQLRGYAQYDEARVAELPPEPTLFGLFGKGFLAITFDRKQQSADEPGGRYQGIVPLEGASLAEACEYYFAQSEQIPTLIRTARGIVGGRAVAGGFLVQHLAEGEDGRERLHVRLDHPEWEHVRALAETIKPEELAHPGLPLEELVWRLFHEEREVRIEQGIGLSKGCRCDPDHIRSVIGRFPRDERREMADEAGDITVDCEFCSRKFPISVASLDN
ncbi:Hsp33 family molecular chaperone HslO [Novosphingopyxis sp.]|uniref:Hsp33 family molecular chaperone HslO n=1 Tax=Novosphingopyxis sp. TaxID=2709690 RepID=UPI003B5BD4E6